LRLSAFVAKTIRHEDTKTERSAKDCLFSFASLSAALRLRAFVAKTIRHEDTKTERSTKD